jgi:hypothetical protein
MIVPALAVLSAAVVLGLVAAVWYLRGIERSGLPPRWLALLHGAAGVAGAGLLLLALQGPTRGVAVGTAGFGAGAMALLAAAMLAGVAIAAAARRSANLCAATVAVHAGLAIAGYVMFLAWAVMG